ncbi:MAG: DUF885 domain-containing protein, partial [Bermanella sp.]
MTYANRGLLPIFSAALLLLLSACQLNVKPQNVKPLAATYSPQEKQQQQQAARTLIAQFSLWELDSSPMLQAYRGQKTNYDRWDDISEQAQHAKHLKNAEFLHMAQNINLAALDSELALSIQLLSYQLKQSHQLFPYRHHNFPLNQLFGWHTEIPHFLVNIHQIHTIKDAKDYVARIKAVRPLMQQLIAQLKIREDKGITAPSFVYESVIEASQASLSGYPFNKDKNAKANVLWSHFETKIKQLELYESSEKVLLSSLKKALKRSYKPAYRALIGHLKQSQKNASANTGFHQFAAGKDFYSVQLQASTTTHLSAQQIHQQGLQEIANIKLNIEQLLPQLGETSIEALFKRTRGDQSLYYQDSARAITDSKHYIRTINEKLGQAFSNIPPLPMEVTQVEAFRQHSTPLAFYQPPSDDGARAGRYYLNQSKLNDMPAFQLEALAYHETIPGHHLQTIYALQNKQLPAFRRHGNFTAYTEGWALYAERLAKELGAYQDPWHEYGRLLMELWRANRMVIDTGLHFYGWDIERAMAFRLSNTPFSEADSLNAIQRYLVMPGQATAYKIGQLHFIKLRQQAALALGKHFNLADYHEFVLSMGPLPLAILQGQVLSWIEAQKTRQENR